MMFRLKTELEGIQWCVVEETMQVKIEQHIKEEWWCKEEEMEKKKKEKKGKGGQGKQN